jgi:diacylglycerol kinase (ATP)
MRVALLYNRDAGEGVSLSQIRETLERHGHAIIRVVENDADSGRLLDEPVDLVVAAGGDGTVSTAARFLVGRGMPLAILPLGTANNIACSLGINGSIQQASFNWSLARRQPLDLGVASASWGVSRFLEAVGTGFIPAGITAVEAQTIDEDKSSRRKIARALSKYRDVLSRLKPRRWTLSLDGIPWTGEFLLVEVLNIRSIGPNLELSLEARPSDGLFCVVTAGEEDREQLDRYLQRRIAGGIGGRLSLVPRFAKRVDLHGLDDIHVDDEVLSLTPNSHVSVRIEPAALEYLS